MPTGRVWSLPVYKQILNQVSLNIMLYDIPESEAFHTIQKFKINILQDLVNAEYDYHKPNYKHYVCNARVDVQQTQSCLT